jgi:uncharacterized RDD family membrane protein YckC
MTEQGRKTASQHQYSVPRAADADFLATAWPRYLARTFDVWCETLFIACAFIAVLDVIGLYPPGFDAWMSRPFNGLLVGGACLPFALVLDAGFYGLFGNTPGKALLGLRVTTLTGNPLSFEQYLGRNFRMWVNALALGLPGIPLFTMMKQWSNLALGRPASYDQSLGFRVRSEPTSLARKVLVGFAYPSVLVLIAVLRTMGEDAQHERLLQNLGLLAQPSSSTSTARRDERSITNSN